MAVQDGYGENGERSVGVTQELSLHVSPMFQSNGEKWVVVKRHRLAPTGYKLASAPRSESVMPIAVSAGAPAGVPPPVKSRSARPFVTLRTLSTCPLGMGIQAERTAS